MALCRCVAAAELKIVGPASVPVGGIAFFKLEGAKAGDPFDYFSADGTLVVLFDAQTTPVGVVNGTQQGSTTLIGVRYDEESKKILRVMLTVPIGPPKPPAPPGPDPLTGLAAKVKGWAEQVASPSRAAEAGKLANSFDAIVSQIGAGTLRTPEEVIKATADSHVRLLGADVLNTWLAFRQALAVELNAMSEAGKLNTAADHSPVWTDISRGLREVK